VGTDSRCGRPSAAGELTLRVAARFALGAEPVSARVCESLREAANEPYFYEALLKLAQKPIPYGEGYERWRREKVAAMAEGQEFYFLGRPSG
jgi:hypothetical protein